MELQSLYSPLELIYQKADRNEHIKTIITDFLYENNKLTIFELKQKLIIENKIDNISDNLIQQIRETIKV